MKNNLGQLRKGREFVGWAEQHGAAIRPAKGSHVMVVMARGGIPVPCHPKDLPTGTRRHIAKTFVLLGLGVLAMVVMGVLPLLP